jgi:hypothetical protein
MTKVVLSVLVVLVAVVVAAAGLELVFGRPRPGFVPLTVLALVAPALWAIWRPRRS